MKKILVLSSFPAGYRYDVFKGLSQYYDLTVIFGTDSNENRNPKWFVKGDKLKYYLADKPEDNQFIKKCYKNLKQFDLVLAYDWYPPWALKFELKAKMIRIPYIINCDGAFIKKSTLKDIIKKFFISNAASCFAGGKYAKQYFLHYGADEKKVFVHNFTSLHEHNILKQPCSNEEKTELRKQLGLQEKTTVLSIGQFIKRKGFDILLDAWEKVEIENSQLVIIGGGNLRLQYEKQIREKNIKNVVIIDFVPFEQIFKYYMASDVFALATREDIWGLIVNESMANGIPVLISDKCIAGLELIENDVNGYIISNNDVIDWTNKLKLLLSDPDLRCRLGCNALNKIQGNTISSIIKEHKKVIDNLLL